MLLSRALTDPKLLGFAFADESWRVWLALVKGAMAEPMTGPEVTDFRRLTQRDPLATPARELWVVAGRRSGKSRFGAALAVALATCHEWPVVVGEVPTVLYLASDRDQAQVAFRYARGLLSASPLLATEVVSETKDRIVLSSGVELQVATSDYRRVRGRSVAVAVLDEVAFWEASPEVSNPDWEVLAALRPALATFGSSLLIALSSPYAQQGILYETFRRYYGVEDPRVLVSQAPSLLLNPTLPPDVVDAALEQDPEAARAEWLAEFRSDVASFLDARLVDSNTRSEPRELPFRAPEIDRVSRAYVAAVDVSGGRGDATAAAITFRERDRVVVAAARCWNAPHDPVRVAREVGDFLSGYRAQVAVADRYGAELAKSIYREAGITLVDAPVSRSDAYLGLLPLLASGRVELPPDPRLRLELLGLERRTRSGGRDSVDHRPGSHDDLANAVALAVRACAQSSSANFSLLATAKLDCFPDLSASVDRESREFELTVATGRL